MLRGTAAGDGLGLNGTAAVVGLVGTAAGTGLGLVQQLAMALIGTAAGVGLDLEVVSLEVCLLW